MITKELLNIVLNFRVDSIVIPKGKSTVWAMQYGENKRIVKEKVSSFYELANICKSTFIYYGKGYCISSFIDFDGTWFANISGAIFKQRFQGTSEPEVIFKAAQWIIDIENESHKIEIDAELEDQYGKAK